MRNRGFLNNIEASRTSPHQDAKRAEKFCSLILLIHNNLLIVLQVDKSFFDIDGKIPPLINVTEKKIQHPFMHVAWLLQL